MFGEFISVVLPIVGGVLILALIGVLVSLVVLIPPIRRLGLRSTIASATVVVVAGAVSFALSFWLFTRLGAEVAYIFSTVGTPPWEEVEDPLEPAIVKELWTRSIVPPPFRQPCYTTDTLVCERADLATPGSEASGDWEAYLLGIGGCLVSSLTGGSLARVFIRRRRNEAY